MKAKLDTMVTAVLVICAVITTSVVVRREFSETAAAPNTPLQKAVFIKDWRADLARGVRMGPAEAPVELVEFTDFECPFCANMHKTLRTLRERYPSQLAIVSVHFPLPGHRFALLAARVAECAGDQGRFESMYDQLFAGQDQFGLKSWDDFATAAHVPNIPVFDRCIAKTEPIPRVEEGKTLGTELDVKGTPTLIVNGWLLGRPPSADELEAMVKAVLAGKSPTVAWK